MTGVPLVRLGTSAAPLDARKLKDVSGIILGYGGPHGTFSYFCGTPRRPEITGRLRHNPSCGVPMVRLDTSVALLDTRKLKEVSGIMLGYGGPHGTFRYFCGTP